MYFQHNSPFFLRGDEVGELEQAASNVFQHQEAMNLSTSTTTTTTGSSYNTMKSNNISIISNDMHFGGLNNSLGAGDVMLHGSGRVDVCSGGGSDGVSLGNEHFHKWRDTLVVADHSQTTDTSTYTDDKTTQLYEAHLERLIDEDSSPPSKGKTGEQKALRRLAQNREAARKSRMRKKAYVHQLESSRLKLASLEQELKKVKQQGMYASVHQSHTTGGNGALAFDIEYGHWIDEHQRLINDLRAALNSHMCDNELRHHVEGVMSHYDEIFKLKSAGAKLDVFHMLFGMWKTPVERCFLWLGGFRSSEILKILGNQIVPLTEQQLVGICNLQQSSQQAEDALSQGMEALQLALVETLSSNSLAPTRNSAANVADYMGLMAIAMSKLATLENFLYQGDLLRQQTLQQLQRILTTRQTARALIAISDYKTRLRTLSSLWSARPKE